MEALQDLKLLKKGILSAIGFKVKIQANPKKIFLDWMNLILFCHMSFYLSKRLLKIVDRIQTKKNL